jgi:hypothetical protein
VDDPSEVAPPPQPGVNGVHYGPKTGYVYYTSTAQQVFMGIPVDPDSLSPAGPPAFVAAIDKTDDFCIDEVAGVAYVTRHRGNTIDRVPLAPGRGSEVGHIAGDPLDQRLLGPSSAACGGGPPISDASPTSRLMAGGLPRRLTGSSAKPRCCASSCSQRARARPPHTRQSSSSRTGCPRRSRNAQDNDVARRTSETRRTLIPDRHPAGTVIAEAVPCARRSRPVAWCRSEWGTA